MQTLESLALRFDGTKIWVLDQTQLPQAKNWLDGSAPENMITFIKNLQIRGAPLIGVAAALCLARQAEVNFDRDHFIKTAGALRAARPTAVNLMVAVDKLVDIARSGGDAGMITRAAEKIFKDDVDLCAQIAEHGAALFSVGDGVLTHCNTGGLATAGVGTAIGIIQKIHEQRKNIHVYVDETRPLLQGGRLTAWEMAELGIPHTLICDNMAAILMREKKVTKVVVGCDRIALNGDFANKVGTYGLAVAAHHHGIPFYVAGPLTTVDFQCASGAQIPIEERHAHEVRGAHGSWGKVTWSPPETPVFNPAFDVTPASLVSAWILDVGVFRSAAELRAALLANRAKA